MSSHVSQGGSLPPSGGVWPYLASPFAAAAAVVPTFRGFVVATARQSGTKVPPFILKQTFAQGCKAAPTVGLVVGVQTTLEKAAEHAIKARLVTSDAPSVAQTMASFASTCFAGFVTSPIYAVFKGQSRNLSVVQSLRAMTPQQAGAISVRETCFLGGLKMSTPVSDAAKKQFGDTKAVQYSSAFVSGAAGSLAGHPFDTALAILQEGKKMVWGRQAFRGACARTVAGGAFSAVYALVKDVFNNK